MVVHLLKKYRFATPGMSCSSVSNCVHLSITKRSEILRFLALFRPQRLLANFDVSKFGSLRILATVPVVSKEFIGDTVLTALKTTTGTFVADGFASHNSNCEFQIIGKVPYPDSRNVITRARSEADPDYAPYIAMQQLVQACGRGNRAEDDQCENFIVDDNITWFMRQNRKFAPKWFMESLTSRMFPPEAPAKLNREGR